MFTFIFENGGVKQHAIYDVEYDGATWQIYILEKYHYTVSVKCAMMVSELISRLEKGKDEITTDMLPRASHLDEDKGKHFQLEVDKWEDLSDRENLGEIMYNFEWLNEEGADLEYLNEIELSLCTPIDEDEAILGGPPFYFQKTTSFLN